MFTSIYISNMMRKNSQLVFDRFWKFNAIKDFVSKLCCRLLLNVISVDELYQIKSWQLPTLILNYFLHVIHLFLSLSCSYFRFHSTCTRKVWPPTRFRYSTVPFFFCHVCLIREKHWWIFDTKPLASGITRVNSKRNKKTERERIIQLLSSYSRVREKEKRSTLVLQ